jgi:hypothetical protein
MTEDDPHQPRREVVALMEEIAAVQGELHTQSDRGAGLIGGAFLDEVLAALFRGVFIKDKEVAGKLLKRDGPLSTFSARIRLAYCLGILPKDTYQDLEQIREIRNAFAHHFSPLSFASDAIRDRCANLRAYRQFLNPGVADRLLPRDKFILGIVYILVELGVAGMSARHREEGAFHWPVDFKQHLHKSMNEYAKERLLEIKPPVPITSAGPGVGGADDAVAGP